MLGIGVADRRQDRPAPFPLHGPAEVGRERDVAGQAEHAAAALGNRVGVTHRLGLGGVLAGREILRDVGCDDRRSRVGRGFCGRRRGSADAGSGLGRDSERVGRRVAQPGHVVTDVGRVAQARLHRRRRHLGRAGAGAVPGDRDHVRGAGAQRKRAEVGRRRPAEDGRAVAGSGEQVRHRSGQGVVVDRGRVFEAGDRSHVGDDEGQRVGSGLEERGVVGRKRSRIALIVGGNIAGGLG